MMDYQSGQTPLDPEEISGLLLPIITQQALDEAENDNIDVALVGLMLEVRSADLMLEEQWLKQLHKMMFNRVWAWAGQFRRTDKNMGVAWSDIPIAYRQLRDDTLFWISEQTFPPDEIAIRSKHRLVSIHPFPNGNGHHSRLMADLLVESLGQAVFTWGVGLPDPRSTYLAALKRADAGMMAPLLDFARQ